MRTETFHTPGAAALSIRVPAGRVEVDAVDGDETRIEIEAEPEVEESARVEARGSEVFVDIEGRKLLGFIQTSGNVRIRVACPAGVRFEFAGVAADLAVRGTTGPATVKTVSGDVSLARVDGDLTLKSVSGDVVVEAVAGRSTVQSVSGDLRLEEADGGVTANTVSGDLRLGAVREGGVNLRSVSGDMQIGIRAGSSLWVEAKSVSGDTSSELPLGDTPENGEGPLVELRATAMSGDIRIVRA